ncbi:MAG: PhzF family phenazine biosynthesis protein [Ilumatobacteraceae bacterium]
MLRRFHQVDVFGDTPFTGNPVAVILDGDGLADEQMASIAQWTNLSETTFVVPATAPGADYRVRIFTPTEELPFAGHPTLGTCHAWLTSGGAPARPGVIVQECPAGLVPVRSAGTRLAFAAPPLVRSGPVDDADLELVTAAMGIGPAEVVAAQWVDNGPGWVALLLDSVETVLAAQPSYTDHKVGLVALHPDGAPWAIEVRGFFPGGGQLFEDPVTGSLNASLAQWLTSSGRLTAPYVARQGTAIGRHGRVHVDIEEGDDGGDIWIGGATVTVVAGTIATWPTNEAPQRA